MKWKIGLILSLAFAFFPFKTEAASYHSLLRKWTHSKEWFSTQNVNINIIWRATFFSPDFRRVFEERHIEKNFLEPLEASRYIAQQEKMAETYHEFFIGLYTRKPYKAFSLSRDSFWQIVLINEQGEVIKPLEIEYVEVTPYEQTMFPYLDRWSVGYRVLFPKVELGKHFKLTLRSVIGESTLKWDRL